MRSRPGGRATRETGHGALQESNHRANGDRRSSPRRKVLKGVKVIYNEGHCSLDCTVANLSEGGACLDLPTYVPLPETVMLHFQDGHEHLAQVVWSTSTRLGVRFVDADAARPEGSLKSVLLERIRVMEAQLDDLRNEIIARLDG